MEIVLVRHGKVNYPPLSMLSASDFAKWVDAYNNNELDAALPPLEETRKIANSVNAVVCSTLPRSIESAKALGVEEITYRQALFNEAELPIAEWRYPKLSVRAWAIAFRLAWLFGYANNSETLGDAKERASQATRQLIELAESHGSVAFIGHGVMNRLIASELRRQGWDGPRSPSSSYWGHGKYKIKT